MLAHVLVVWMVGWQQERDLTNRLSVYRSVDSLVEFYIPWQQQATGNDLSAPATEGFVYQDSYYDIVRQEVKNDTLLLLGYAKKQDSFWTQDLLAFINHEFGNDSTTIPLKAHHLLKNVVHDYDQGVRFVINFWPPHWQAIVRIPALDRPVSTLSLPVQSPPPEISRSCSV